MLERVLTDPMVIARLRSSPLGEAFDRLVDQLVEQRYQGETIRQFLRGCSHFAYWLQRARIQPAGISEGVVDRFLNHQLSCCTCPAPRGRAIDTRAGLFHLLRKLRADGVASPAPTKPKTPIDRVVEDFGQHLSEVCGITAGTIVNYKLHVRPFLLARFGSGPIELGSIKASDLIGFISQAAKRPLRWWARATTTALRSFFRFLQLKGICNPTLVDAVPTVPVWALANLPKALTEEQLATFLRSFKRSTASGLRDYAIVVCLVDLGLRAGEAATLSLDDIDWRAGTIQIMNAKGRRSGIMPLPTRPGRAIANYLQKGRPRTEARQVFVRHRPPVGAPIRPQIIGAMIRRSFERAYLNVSPKSSHVLRHTAATLMIQKGASIKEIADVLRHRRISTTAIYSKVNLPMLSAVAMPWPEVRP
jgi:site-specific recombinase XerD